MRRSFEVVLFYLFATGAANLLSQALPGVSISHGTGATRSSLDQSINSFDPGSGLGETLFGALQAGLTTFEGIIEAIFALPILMGNLGVPGPIIAFLMLPAGLVVVYDGIHIMTGRFA